MSDFLFSSRPAAPGTLAAVLARWLGAVTAETREYHGAWGSLAVARAPHDPEPVFEDDRAVTVLVGEPFARLPGAFPGAAAEDGRRRLVHTRLASGARDGWDEALDGQFAAFSVGKAGGGGIAVTDLFAWIPVFASERRDPEPRVVVGTHADAVAEAAGVRDEIDPVSAAELLGFYAITPPRTLYPAVRQLPAGSVRAFASDGWTGEPHAYWRPVEKNPFASVDEAAEALREALVADVALACEGHRRVGIMLSGGEDSRAILGAVPDGVGVQAFIYTENPNREVRVAGRVARAYGASLRYGRREPGHDLRHFEAVAAMTGTQNQFIDVHGYGLHASMGIQAMPMVLGGFSSDALLKADNVPPKLAKRVRRGETLGFRDLPMPPLPGVREEIVREAYARRDAYRRSLAEIRPESADEWSYIYPLTQRRYAGNVHGNRRLWRAHEPFMSNPVVKIAAAVPQRWKIDRGLFFRAVRPLLAKSWYVPHSRNRMPYFSKRFNAVARPVLGLVRDTRDLVTGQRGRVQESWPFWAELVRTPLMMEKAGRYPVAESAVGALFGADPARAVTTVREEWRPLRQIALLQLAYLTSPGLPGR